MSQFPTRGCGHHSKDGRTARQKECDLLNNCVEHSRAQQSICPRLEPPHPPSPVCYMKEVSSHLVLVTIYVCFITFDSSLPIGLPFSKRSCRNWFLLNSPNLETVWSLSPYIFSLQKFLSLHYLHGRCLEGFDESFDPLNNIMVLRITGIHVRRRGMGVPRRPATPCHSLGWVPLLPVSC